MGNKCVFLFLFFNHSSKMFVQKTAINKIVITDELILLLSVNDHSFTILLYDHFECLRDENKK